MGDVLLTYDEYGREYVRRIICCNILFISMLALTAVFSIVDGFVALLAALSASVVSIVYAFYFIHKNPPAETQSASLKV